MTGVTASVTEIVKERLTAAGIAAQGGGMDESDPTSGNERLTAATGAVLVVLLAVIGVTLLALRPLLSVHLFVGMLLIGPVLLKLASTGYRFVRYYTHDPRYRLKGPPPAVMRMIAPVVVISTVVVFASGVALLFIGPGSREDLLPIHKVSFIVWVAFTALHVLGHLLELPPALRSELDLLGARASADQDSGRAVDLTGGSRARAGRLISLAGALVGGVVLAILTLPQFDPWLHQRLLTGGH